MLHANAKSLSNYMIDYLLRMLISNNVSKNLKKTINFLLRMLISNKQPLKELEDQQRSNEDLKQRFKDLQERGHSLTLKNPSAKQTSTIDSSPPTSATSVTSHSSPPGLDDYVAPHNDFNRPSVNFKINVPKTCSLLRCPVATSAGSTFMPSWCLSFLDCC